VKLRETLIAIKFNMNFRFYDKDSIIDFEPIDFINTHGKFINDYSGFKYCKNTIFQNY